MEIYGSTEDTGMRGGVEFTMSLEGSKSPNAKCEFRRWDKAHPSFYKAPERHRASMSGTVQTRAAFKIFIEGGDWTLKPYKAQIPWSYTPSGFAIDSRGNVLHL